MPHSTRPLLCRQGIRATFVPLVIVRFAWAYGEPTGWGQYGRGLAEALTRLGHTVLPADDHSTTADCTFHPVGNTFAPCPDTGPTRRNVALVVSESTDLTTLDIAHLRTYDTLLAGSGWNTTVLHRHGLPDARSFPQGCDTRTFRPLAPLPASSVRPRFTVFSGGKFEFRKGQDLVLDTFRRLQKLEPDLHPLLVVAWHNFWPATVGPLHHTGLLTSLPRYDPTTRRHAFADWLPTQGIAPADFLVLDLLDPPEMAKVVRQCDVGLFLSRCEANANMALAECLASGVPCVVSKNTGHLVYDGEPLITFVTHQCPVRLSPATAHGTDGWGESDCEEAAHALASLATPPDAVWRAWSDFASRWSWDARALALLDLLTSH